jgi:plasmid stabilization system protein ParE
MPRLKISPRAQADIFRLYNFLAEKDQAAAVHAVSVIESSFIPLTQMPKIGRKLESSALRELVIGFGSSGYIALYSFDEARDEVVVAALRHQKERNYK